MGPYFDVIDSPLGPLYACADERGALTEIRLRGDAPVGVRDVERLSPVRRQLDEYFAGERREFELALDPLGTAFQQRVWHALLTIGYGKIVSYRRLAELIGSPAATRAVGRANGANRIPIVIPCHRVIASDGSLGGYSGGLDIKARLLALEGHSYAI